MFLVLMRNAKKNEATLFARGHVHESRGKMPLKCLCGLNSHFCAIIPTAKTGQINGLTCIWVVDELSGDIRPIKCWLYNVNIFCEVLRV